MADDITPFEAFELAVARARGQSGLARLIGCTPGNISQLLKKRSPLPGRFAIKAEAGTGVSRHHLCPELYPLNVESKLSTGNDSVACDRVAVLDRVARG